MSDENEEDPEIGAEDGGSIPAAGPGTENAVGNDIPTTPQMGDASCRPVTSVTGDGLDCIFCSACGELP